MRLGKRNDAADTHIKIILNQERGVKPAPPQIKAPTPNRTPSPHSSSHDDEVEQLAQLEIVGSGAVEDVPNKTSAEIIRADLENRCSMMRVQNDDIQRALTTSSGT